MADWLDEVRGLTFPCSLAVIDAAMRHSTGLQAGVNEVGISDDVL